MLTEESIEHIRGIVAEHGSDAWWEMEVADLLPPVRLKTIIIRSRNELPYVLAPLSHEGVGCIGGLVSRHRLFCCPCCVTRGASPTANEVTSVVLQQHFSSKLLL